MKIFLIFLFLSCGLDYLKEAKRKAVLSYYEDYFVVVNKIDNKRIKKWHNYFTKNPNSLKELCRKFFSIPKESNFDFKFFAYDSLNKRYLIRYFAFKPNPIDIAGWQVIFIFNEKGNLDKVYVSEVPLEK
ncbi:MAG: hypothetical protein N2323_05120 [candidate division WOR-3 bacterium]|nr:hypothetical protein [candidate division WOR-3 bacterium]MCX7837321.1 hypothetical protein [candidate division WOR-3 bacterium]MDW8114616.1 hypothetical protein [candidate division WOR-3 bacterium]